MKETNKPYYFQFIPTKHLYGRIQFCSLAAQGLFIEICSFYWQRECSIKMEQLSRKYSENIGLIDELIEEKVIVFSSKGNILIPFLKKQYLNFSKKSAINSINGKAGVRIKKIKKQTKEKRNTITKKFKKK